MENNLSYKTINEVAEDVKISDSTLRFWEKKFPSVIRPLRRSGGRRYYTDTDIAVIRAIKKQIYDNARSIAEVQTAIADGFLSDLLKGDPRYKSESGDLTLFPVSTVLRKQPIPLPTRRLSVADLTVVIKDLEKIKTDLDSLL